MSSSFSLRRSTSSAMCSSAESAEQLQCRSRGWNCAIRCENASAVELTALGEREFHAMPRIAKNRNARAQQDRMDVEADLVDEPGSEQRPRELAAAHQTDVLARTSLQPPHETRRIVPHELD